MSDKMKAYKGFGPGLKCRGFQFKEGETFETEGEPKLCENGFHACEDPIDCLGYYPPCDSEYHEVELEGVSPERNEDDSKIVAKRITIGAKLSLRDLISACIQWSTIPAISIMSRETPPIAILLNSVRLLPTGHLDWICL